MRALVSVYLGRWNHRLEIEVRGLSKKYEAVYDGELLDEEIEKMLKWKGQQVHPHPDWVPVDAFQPTDETFGLNDPISPSNNTVSEEEAEALLEKEADDVVTTLLELDTEVTEEYAILNKLPESSRWLARSFGRWRPSGPVRGNEEWRYFIDNLPTYQKGRGITAVSEADNHSSILWSAYADHWNEMVTGLGANKPQFTYKTASLLQDAHKKLLKRRRRDTTVLPMTAAMNNLREVHTSSSSNQKFSSQFVSADPPTRAIPSNSISVPLNSNRSGTLADNSNDMVDHDDFQLESPAEQERRAFAGCGRRRRRTNANVRCRKCGKEWNTEPWRSLHERGDHVNNSKNSSIKNRWHGEGNQVWDYCQVPPCEREPGFPIEDGRPLPRRKKRRS